MQALLRGESDTGGTADGEMQCFGSHGHARFHSGPTSVTTGRLHRLRAHGQVRLVGQKPRLQSRLHLLQVKSRLVLIKRTQRTF